MPKAPATVARLVMQTSEVDVERRGPARAARRVVGEVIDAPVSSSIWSKTTVWPALPPWPTSVALYRARLPS
ncbi:MAG: hypothetical protein R2849_23270 [Thermomicrobiales bacterium]